MATKKTRTSDSNATMDDGNVMTSIALTFGDKKFDQEDAFKTGDNNDPDDFFAPILVTYHYLFPASPSLALKVSFFWCCL
jgi:hypothetical protein